MSTDLPPPPAVLEIPYAHVEHGIERDDPYHWLRERDDPRVLEHLQAENAYTDAVMASTRELRQQVYGELIGRIEESTTSAPWNEGQWTYRSRIVKGQQYPIYERRPREGNEAWDVFFDANKEAGDAAYFDIAFLDISPDGTRLAYAIDTAGDEAYTLRFRDLTTGQDLEDCLTGVSGTGEWDASGNHYFYIREDDARRPYRLFLHTIGSEKKDRLLYEEKDSLFYLGLEKSQDLHFLFAVSESQETTEVRTLPADLSDESFSPTFGRQTGHQYDLEHHNGNWLVRTNLDAPDFKLLSVPVGTTSLADASCLVPPDRNARLEAVLPLVQHLVLFERAEGLDRIRVIDTATNSIRTLPTEDSVYDIESGHNAEYAVAYLNIEYSSPIRPHRTLRYHLDQGTIETLKEQKVPSGHDPSDYRVERISVPSHDGVLVPLTLIRHKDLDTSKPNPVYMYGYGAYGSPVYTGFRTSWLTWLQRGFLAAIPHVRGGGLLGEHWYQDGKLENKANSFQDCLACARYLVQHGWTQPRRIALHGASAGGLLVGATLNLEPELFGVVIAEVPFVDVLNTMLDPSLPLTEFEYEEWGNPQERNVFDRIRRYAPYEAIQPSNFPPILATAGLNDPRVPYWEAAKWVARLRKNQTSPAPILLKTDTESGHGGPSGRYREWEETATLQSFVLQHLSHGWSAEAH